MPILNSQSKSVIIGLVIVLCAQSCATGPLNAQRDKQNAGEVHGHSLAIDGTKRELSYFVPAKSDFAKLPIVIYLHGHGDNMRHILGKGRIRSASAVWMEVAGREGFLVFYPLGLRGGGRVPKTAWNDCRENMKGNPQSDDVKFIRKVIDFAVEKQNGDRRRVYVTGMSNGGHMTMRVAMEMSKEVAAVAPVMALLPKSHRCAAPKKPIPIMMMHGTDDPLAPFEGGQMAGGRGEVLSARETEETWVKWNQLEDLPVKASKLPDNNTEDESTIVKRVRERSQDGDAVVAYEVRGGGHTEPSRVARTNLLLKRILGNQNRDIEMAETIWNFFKTRSR